MEAVLQFLNSIHHLSDALKDHLAGILKYRVLEKREHLLKAGQVCRNIYFIRKGLLHCYHLRGHVKQTSWFMQGGDVVISVKSFYNQIAGSEFIQALENTELIFITYEELEFIYNHFEEFNYTGRRLTQKYYELCNERAYTLSNCDAKGRYFWFVNNFPNLMQLVPARHIASFLGITEETLSRIRKQYQIS